MQSSFPTTYTIDRLYHAYSKLPIDIHMCDLKLLEISLAPSFSKTPPSSRRLYDLLQDIHNV